MTKRKNDESAYSPALLIILLILLWIFASNVMGGIVPLLWKLLYWIATGAITGLIVRGSSYDLLKNGLLGFAGGILGGALVRFFGLHFLYHIPLVGLLVVGILGAVTLVYAMRIFVDKNFAR
ncbi:MAG: hypothetical protein H6670_02750 [Anaerolineaceae bacterium]|nr:hypothetical protein [Anaerolineaceae bacterium]